MFEKARHGVLLPAIIVNLTLAQCSPQKNNTNADQQSGSKVVTTARPYPPAPIPEGKAAGELTSFRPTNEDLKDAIIGHPFPKVWLTFTTSGKQGQPQSDSSDKGESTVKVELPDEANQLLRAYWQTYLSAAYNMDLKGMPDPKSYRAQMDIADRSANVTEWGLMRVDIDAPNGRRKISLDEARDLSGLLRRFARDIINQAKAR